MGSTLIRASSTPGPAEDSLPTVKPTGFDLEELAPKIDEISRRVSSNYPDISWEDVRQHLYLFLLEKSQSFKYEGDGTGARSILYKVAKSYCKAERAAQNYLSPQYSYRPSDVTRILETAFDSNKLPETFVPEDAESLLPSADSLDAASDVREAYDMLSKPHQICIFLRYGLGVVPNNSSYERKKLNNAVRELTALLNSYKIRPAGRRAVSNAKAQAMISKGY